MTTISQQSTQTKSVKHFFDTLFGQKRATAKKQRSLSDFINQEFSKLGDIEVIFPNHQFPPA